MSSSCSGQCSSACAGSCEAKYPEPLKRIKHKILVLSGKGGVGKSTVAASLAVTLAKEGKKVGLLDLDFHGPSQPTLFHLQEIRLGGTEKGIAPAVSQGVKIVSLGLLLEDSDAAVIWRGPAKIGVLNQLFEEIDWGDEDLDYLVLDFPPGTGDEALSACQLIPGEKQAVIVTTPQELSLADCRKCIGFCDQVHIPVGGIIENMSGFICPSCSAKHNLFSSGGGQKLSGKYGIPLIAQVPMDPRFLQKCDEGDLSGALEQSPAVAEELVKAAKALSERAEKES